MSRITVLHRADRKPDREVGGPEGRIVGRVSYTAGSQPEIALEKRRQDGNVLLAHRPVETWIGSVGHDILHGLVPSGSLQIAPDPVRVHGRIGEVDARASHEESDGFGLDDSGQGRPEKGDRPSVAVVGMDAGSPDFQCVFEER